MYGISLEDLYVDIGAKRVNSIDCDNNFCSMTLRSELYLPGKKSVQEEPVYAYEIHTGATGQQSNIQVYLDFIIIAMLQSLIFAAPTFLVSTCVTPTIKCTETSSTVHVLSQDAISVLVPM